MTVATAGPPPIPRPAAGFLAGGLPFNRTGHGAKTLVVFQGLVFENKPLDRLSAYFAAGLYRFLEDDFTVFMVGRRPNLPDGYTMRDMAHDYAAAIEQEFSGPVDVIGTSTGGPIALHFAADHPGLLRRLVIHSSAYTLTEAGKAVQLEVARLAERGRWREAYAKLLWFVWPPTLLGKFMTGLASRVMAFSTPADASDLVVTIQAEDAHACKERLGEVAAPTLFVAGADDPGYSEMLIRATAAGIPNCRLILYPGMGHPARGKQFAGDVLAFLREHA